MYPTISQYNTEITRIGGNIFITQKDLEFIPSRTTPFKIFSYGTGSYAVVFKCSNNSKTYAIRCFINSNTEVLWRYKKIDSYLKNLNEQWVTRFDFIENEIIVQNQIYPIVKMEWIEGKLLNNFVGSILHDNISLGNLQKAIISLSNSLEDCKVGHGDIQCGNLIIQGDKTNPIVRLIDYDGMYLLICV